MGKSTPNRTGVGMSFLDLHILHPVFGSQKVHASSDEIEERQKKEEKRAVWLTKGYHGSIPCRPRAFCRFESAFRMSNKKATWESVGWYGVEVVYAVGVVILLPRNL